MVMIDFRFTVCENEREPHCRPTAVIDVSISELLWHLLQVQHARRFLRPFHVSWRETFK